MIFLPKEDHAIKFIDGDKFQHDLPLLVKYIKSCGYMIKGRKEPVRWYNIYTAFDIETTKIYNLNWQACGDSEKYKYFNIPFCWQFAIDDFFIFGRKIENFFKLVKRLHTALKGSFIVYIHNIKYEYNNLADYFEGAEIFFRDNSTPVYIRHDGIEYRCSAQLTHKSLAQVGEEIGYNKLKGDFDYNIQRNEDSKLDPIEINYCFRDVMILTRYIRFETANYCREMKIKNVNPVHLPYTQTGYPRKDIRKNWSDTPEGRKILEESALDEKMYLHCNAGFWGGYVHSNYRNVGVRFLRRLEQIIRHFDIVSAYPAVMILKKFPLAMFWATSLSPSLFIKNLSREDYAQIADITLTDVRLNKGCIPYIPYSPDKCEAEGEVLENGKVVIASRYRITLTDVDMRLIMRNYTFKIEKIHSILCGIKKHLPFNVVSVLLKYFNAKTELKGVIGSEYEYGLGKQKLNGIYGLAASALIHDLFEVNENTFEIESTGTEYKPANVLPYQWAPYVTAYVREIIYGTISAMPDKSKYIYSDTDSLFYIDNEETNRYIEEYNTNIKMQLSILENKYFNIMPVNPKGQKQYLGTLAEENDDIAEFCTIGAKRYYIIHSDGFADVTFSGLSATKAKYDKATKQRIANGFNTDRLIKKGGGSLYKAFKMIKDNHIYLEYVEGVDKLSNYNVRAPFYGECCGKKYSRPCSFVLFPVDTDLTLNTDLFAFLGSQLSVELF